MRQSFGQTDAAKYARQSSCFVKSGAGAPGVGPRTNGLLRQRGRQRTGEQPKILEKSEIDKAGFFRKELLENLKERSRIIVRMNNRLQLFTESALELKLAKRKLSQ